MSDVLLIQSRTALFDRYNNLTGTWPVDLNLLAFLVTSQPILTRLL